jgi:hypothetical protein
MWDLYTMGFYFTIRRMSFAGKWMELENIILSEVSQALKAKTTCFLSCVEHRSNTNTTILYI